MEHLIHSPKLIFNFKSEIQYDDYLIDKQHYEKLLLTLKYIKNNNFKKLESKYLDEEQLIEIHRWLGKDCYVEYRNFECEYATDIVTLDLFENPDDSYANLLIFQTKEQVTDIYNKLVMGNDYYGRGFVMVEDFEWNIYDIIGIDIKKKEIEVEDIDKINFYSLSEYEIEDIINGYEEMILL
jgi:hypothetical protein